MFVVPTYLKQSEISGIGVFAGSFIKKGQVVWVFDPRVDKLISYSAYEILESKAPEIRDLFEYHLYTDRSIFKDGYIFNADNAKFTNHSFTPNIECTTKTNRALRDIHPGEELTCNYRDFDWVNEDEMPEFIRMPPMASRSCA